MKRLWDSFYGNEQVKETLALACEGGRLPHAFLLEGESGCGKKTFARLLAAAAVCTGENPPCGLCRDCTKTLEHAHPDVMLEDGGVDAKRLNVEAVRAIRAQANVKPNEAARKVFILANAQAMTPQAQNALLKVLEEPPGGVMFILTCENRFRLLETILSRVTLVRLKPLEVAVCARALQDSLPGQPDAVYQSLAEACAGNLGRAKTALQAGSAGPSAAREAAERVAHAAVLGTEYNLLCELAAFENDRVGLAACMAQLKIVFAELLREKYVPATTPLPHGLAPRDVTAAQCSRFIQVAEQALGLFEQNMGYPLLSVWLCSQIRRAATENSRGA